MSDTNTKPKSVKELLQPLMERFEDQGMSREEFYFWFLRAASVFVILGQLDGPEELRRLLINLRGGNEDDLHTQHVGLDLATCPADQLQAQLVAAWPRICAMRIPGTQMSLGPLAEAFDPARCPAGILAEARDLVVPPLFGPPPLPLEEKVSTEYWMRQLEPFKEPARNCFVCTWIWSRELCPLLKQHANLEECFATWRELAQHPAEVSTPSTVARLMSTLAAEVPARLIYDPCFGVGTVLVDRLCSFTPPRDAAGNLDSSRWKETQITGMELRPELWLVATARLLSAGAIQIDLQIGDSIEATAMPPQQRSALVVAVPPSSGEYPDHPNGDCPVPTTSLCSLLVQTALRRLDAGGLGVIVVPRRVVGGFDRDQALWYWIRANYDVLAVVPLPPKVVVDEFDIPTSVLLVANRAERGPAWMPDESIIEEWAKEDSAAWCEETISKTAAYRLGVLPFDGFINSILKSLATSCAGRWTKDGQQEHIRKAIAEERVKALEVIGSTLDQVAPGQATRADLDRMLSKLEQEVLSAHFETTLYTWEAACPGTRRVTLRDCAELRLGVDPTRLPQDCPPSESALRSEAIPLVMADEAAYLRLRSISESGPRSEEERRAWATLGLKHHGASVQWPAGVRLIPKGGSDAIDEEHKTRPGDVLLFFADGIPTVHTVGEKQAGWVVSDEVVSLRPSANVDPQFLATVLRSLPFAMWFDQIRKETGSGCPNASAILALPVVLPPMPIQHEVGGRSWIVSSSFSSATLCSMLSEADPEVRLQRAIGEDLGLVHACSTGGPPDARYRDACPKDAWIGAVERWIRSDSSLATCELPAPSELDESDWHVGGINAQHWLSCWRQNSTRLVRALRSTPPGADRLFLLEAIKSTDYDPDIVHADSVPWVPDTKINSFLNLLWNALFAAVRAESRKLLTRLSIAVRAEPPVVEPENNSEVRLVLTNEGTLGLLDVRVRTTPHNSDSAAAYLGPAQTIAWDLTIPPLPMGTHRISIRWSATRLDYETVEGVEEVALDVRASVPMASHSETGENPYQVGRAVEGNEAFFGRHETLNQIRTALAPGAQSRILLLEGFRRIGKTSILRRLLAPGYPTDWVAVYVNLQGGEGLSQARGLANQEIFYKIAREVVLATHSSGVTFEALGIGPVGPSMSRAELEMKHLDALRASFQVESPFERLCAQVNEIVRVLAPKRLLLLLDEFDIIQEGIDSGVTGPHLPENLRTLFQSHPSLAGILAGEHRMSRMKAEYWSALYGLGISIQVKGLDLDSARDLVTKPVQGRLVFSASARDKVVSLCSRQPFLIQSLCYQIFEKCKESDVRSLTTRTVDEVAGEFVRGSAHLRSVWNRVSNSRQKFLTCIIGHPSKGADRMTADLLAYKMEQAGLAYPTMEALHKDLDELREQDIIQMTPVGYLNEYALSLPLFGLWIAENEDPERYRQAAIE